MADRSKTLLLSLVVLVLTGAGIVTFAAPAAARVSIVPDTATGGGTQTFAFRLANERTDTASTELELVFPQDPPVAFVEIDPAPGWSATVTPRPLNPPLRADGKLVTEVAGSIVLRGGSVAPRQFEQFVVTMGPLPATGRLAFVGTQRYANGDVERLTGDLAPVINFGDTPPPAQRQAASPARAEDAAGEVPAAPLSVPGEPADAAVSGEGGLSPLLLLWAAIGLAILVVAAVALHAHVQRRRGEKASEEVAP